MKAVATLIALLYCAGVAFAKSPCQLRDFDGDRFTVCAYDPQTDNIHIAWRSADGAPLRGFPALKAMLGPRADAVRFAMNAGMFHLGGAPVGLFVAGGVQEKPLNRRRGPGNFHMLPNGVFWVGRDGRAHVDAADDFAEKRGSPVLATQSGPMLLIDGNLHPRIQRDGPSRLIRNGVGETSGNGAVFVISESAVSFGMLARFFRDELAVRNALFLDGSVSSLWEPSRRRMDVRAFLGPIIWVD
jgi:uncharacterized protein YigE (DUF2233 family)